MNCNNFIYDLIDGGGLTGIENISILKATISSIDRINNTADITYSSSCDDLTLQEKDVKFFYHCQYSKGDAGYLQYGHSAFLVGDEVYVIYVPATETKEVEVYIIGHASIENTKPCTGEIMCARITLYSSLTYSTVGSAYQWITVFDSQTGEIITQDDLVNTVTIPDFPISANNLPSDFRDNFTLATLGSFTNWHTTIYNEDGQTGFPWTKNKLIDYTSYLTNEPTYSDCYIAIEDIPREVHGNNELTEWSNRLFKYSNDSTGTAGTEIVIPYYSYKNRCSGYISNISNQWYGVSTYKEEVVKNTEMPNNYNFYTSFWGKNAYVRNDDSTLDGIFYINVSYNVYSHSYTRHDLDGNYLYSSYFDDSSRTRYLNLPWNDVSELTFTHSRYLGGEDNLNEYDYYFAFIENCWIATGENGLYGYSVHVNFNDMVEKGTDSSDPYQYSFANISYNIKTRCKILYEGELNDSGELKSLEDVKMSELTEQLPYGPIKDLIDLAAKDFETKCNNETNESELIINDYYANFDCFILKEIP